MFDVLDRQTRLTGNQKKILPPRHRRCAGVLRLLPDRLRAGLRHRPVEADLRPVGLRAAVVRRRRDPRRLHLGLDRRPIGRREVFIGTVLNFSIATGLLYFTPDNGWIDFDGDALLRRHRRRRPLLRRPAAGPGVHADLQARLHRWPTAVIPLGVGLGAVLAPVSRRATSGACCSPSASCRRGLSCWSGCGFPNCRIGWHDRAASRRRASRSPGRCRSGPNCCRCRPQRHRTSHPSRPTG